MADCNGPNAAQKILTETLQDRTRFNEKFQSAPSTNPNVTGAEYFEFRNATDTSTSVEHSKSQNISGNWAQEFAVTTRPNTREFVSSNAREFAVTTLSNETIAFEQAFSKIEISKNDWAKEFQGTAAQNVAWINEFSQKTDWASEPVEGADSWIDEFKSANLNEDDGLKLTAQGMLNSLELEHDSKLRNSRFVAYLRSLAGNERDGQDGGFKSTTKSTTATEDWADEFKSTTVAPSHIGEFENWKQDFLKNIEPLENDKQWTNMEKAWEEYQGTGYGYENFAQREFGIYHFSVPVAENPYHHVPNKTELVTNNVDLKNSILLHEAIVTEDPNSASAWMQLGTLQQANECDAQAIAAFLKSLALNPSNKDALIGLAASCINESCIPDALEAFQRLLGSSEKGSTIETILGRFESLPGKSRHLVLATAMLNNMAGNYSRAEELLGLVAQDWVTLNRLGASFANAKEYHKAIRIYDQLLSAGHNLPRIHYNKGISLMCLESHDEAARSFIKSIETQIPVTNVTGVKEELLPSYRAPWEALQVNFTIQGREDLAALNLPQLKSALGPLSEKA